MASCRKTTRGVGLWQSCIRYERKGRPSMQGAAQDENPRPGRCHRRRRHRLLDFIPSGKIGLDRCCPFGARRADQWQHMACRGEHPWAARQHQYQPHPALHDDALQPARGRDRPKLRRVPAGITVPCPNRSPRTPASPASGQGQALRHELPRGQSRRGRGVAPAGQFRRHPLHHVRTRRRQRGPVRCDRRLCRRRAAEGGGDPPLHARHSDRAATGRHMDRANAQGRHSH